MRDKDPLPTFQEARIEKLKETPVREVSPGMYQIGTVMLDQKAKSITFPATVNQERGPAEYLLVTSWGAIHESVFQTKTRPFHIHIAMLLLGVKPHKIDEADKNKGNAGPPPIQQGPIMDPVDAEFEGKPVEVFVHWKDGDAKKEFPVSAFIKEMGKEGNRPDVELIYNGSRVLNNLFAGEIEGSVVSLIANPLALMNNTREGRLTDDVWEVNGAELPARDAPVEITVKIVDENK